MHGARNGAASIASGQRLLNWLTEQKGAFPQRLKMRVEQCQPGGRGLVATEDVLPGEVLLTVPWNLVFEDSVSISAGS